MRVLLTDHFPLAASASGRYCRLLAMGLQQAGHEVRVLVVADRPQPAEAFPLRAVVCRAGDSKADLPFALPGFSAESPAGNSFLDLTSQQVAAYREELRRQIDVEVAEFDPHVIHAQYVWIEGQLVLESGVPYVLTAWGPELDCYDADEQYHPLVNQAAENASRILVADELTARRLEATFEGVAERLLVCDAPPQGADAIGKMADVYRVVFEERFGRVL